MSWPPNVLQFPMPLSLRGHLSLVAAAYALILGLSLALIVQRYLQYLRHPEDVAAAGGMYAGGDVMLGLFIAVLLLIPTLWLAFVARQSEALSTRYAQALLGVSLTAPVCLGVISIAAVNQSNSLLGEACLYRLICAPVVLVGIVLSRLLARFPQAKRLTSYAVGIEFLTLVLMVGLLFFSGGPGRG